VRIVCPRLKPRLREVCSKVSTLSLNRLRFHLFLHSELIVWGFPINSFYVQPDHVRFQKTLSTHSPNGVRFQIAVSTLIPNRLRIHNKVSKLSPNDVGFKIKFSTLSPNRVRFLSFYTQP
jgi:hypothetical protein